MKELSTLRKNEVGSRIHTMQAAVDMLHKTRNTEYTVEGIRAMGLFPWARNARTIVKIIKLDMEGDNELRARVEGEKNGKRYFIKGKDILSYIERYGAVLTGRRLKR